jgi:cystathionine beta-lyase/cystathionine gamma-synthase
VGVQESTVAEGEQRQMKLATRLIHGGDPEPRFAGSLSIPIFQSVVFQQLRESEAYDEVVYPRLNNLPNQTALARKLALLENGEDALVTASGMAAVSTSLLSVLTPGGHLLAQGGVYGGTHTLITEHFTQLGLEFDFVDANDPGSWKPKLKANTKAFFVEAMTNPLLRIADHAAVAAFAREHRLVSIVDNTFATPINFRPLDLGFDLSIHSGTKYLNGHNDLAAGAIIGGSDLIKQIRHRLNHFGAMLDPHACFLFNRGLKTLAIRIQQQNSNGLALARFLEAHPAVERLNYPGLSSHPDYERAQTLFAGSGAVLSFELRGGAAASRRFLDRLRIAVHGPSLGGVETLAMCPARTSHAGLSPQERERLGITDGLVRVSVGIEDIDDLMADFAQALMV